MLDCLIALSGFPTIPTLVVCDASLTPWISDIARSGVDDFLFEPYSDEELRVRVQRALGFPAVPRDVSVPSSPALVRLSRNLIGTNRKFLDQVDRLAAYARCDATVLILGETGTGKEIFAQGRALHVGSCRRSWSRSIAARSPTISSRTNCSDMSAALTRRRMPIATDSSRKPKADRFFSTMSIACRCPAQAKLLRLLQEREFLRGRLQYRAARECSSHRRQQSRSGKAGSER